MVVVVGCKERKRKETTAEVGFPLGVRHSHRGHRRGKTREKVRSSEKKLEKERIFHYVL